MPPGSLSYRTCFQSYLPLLPPRPKSYHPSNCEAPRWTLTVFPYSSLTETTLSHECILLTQVIDSVRGRNLTPIERTSVELTAKKLENNNPSVFDFPTNLTILNGEWRLIYSSVIAKTAQSLFRTDDGNIAGVGIAKTRAVWQRFMIQERQFCNVIGFRIGPSPLVPFFGRKGLTGEVRIQGMFEAVASNEIKVMLKEAQIAVEEPFSGAMRTLPSIPIPRLVSGEQSIPGESRLPSNLVTMTYLGSQLRITRDGNGELRIFCRN